MTREEAIEILIREIDEDPFMRTEHRELIHGALNMAIKALEQEPIPDKIRAEIESLPKIYPFVDHIYTYIKTSDCLKIIDKYRSESEE